MGILILQIEHRLNELIDFELVFSFPSYLCRSVRFCSDLPSFSSSAIPRPLSMYAHRRAREIIHQCYLNKYLEKMLKVR